MNLVVKEKLNKMKQKLITESPTLKILFANEKSFVTFNKDIKKITNGLLTLGRKLVAEFLGTYFLVFAGTGAIILDFLTEDLTHFGVSVVFGLAAMIAIHTFSHISGAHINPAVTVGFFIRREIGFISAIGYMASQILGALAASWSLYAMFGNVAYLGATLPRGNINQTFTLEFILTFFLVMVYLTSTSGKANKILSGITIGATVFFATFFGGPLTGASLNPARSIGPAILSETTQSLWIYLSAALLAAVVAALISKFIEK